MQSISSTEPILLRPIFKDYLSGGRKLAEKYGKQSDLPRMAESWELAAHKNGQSIVASGAHCGLQFGEYLKQIGKVALGTHGANCERFPVLIKFIDAKQSLSIQVHPDDAYAAKYTDDSGKTEAWYVLDAEPGAFLYHGFSKSITKEEYRRRIADGTITDVLRAVPVKAGDVFFIPPGTVHAIGAGMLIYEVQQNSDTTYRVYDFDRVDTNGQKRPLHIEEAIAVSDLHPPKLPQTDSSYTDAEGNSHREVAACSYFRTESVTFSEHATISMTEASFGSLILVSGSAVLYAGETVLPIKAGDSVFIPAQNANLTVKGNGEYLFTTI